MKILKKCYFVFLKGSIAKQFDDSIKMNLNVLGKLGLIFLILIIYIISCEMTQYGFMCFENLSKDVNFK